MHIHLTICFSQRDVLNEERRKIISDQAKKLIRDEPSVLEAAEKEFKGILNYFTSRFHQLKTRFIPFYSKRYSFPELPATARLDDLSKLLNLDTKNLNLEQLGLDAIKEQHRINLQFSSDKCAVIPEDRAQVMLAAVSICLHRI